MHLIDKYITFSLPVTYTSCIHFKFGFRVYVELEFLPKAVRKYQL